MRYAWKLMLLCVCLLLGVSLYGQTGGAPNFSAEDDHGADSVDLSTLLPTFRFPIVGNITLNSPQGCHWTGTLQNGNWICSYDQYSSTYPMAALTPTLSSQPMGMTPSISDWSTDSNNCTTITMVGVLASNLSTLHPFKPNQQGVYPSAYYPSTCGNTSVTATTNDSSGLTATLSLTNANTPVFSVYDASGSNETVTGTWYLEPDDGSYTVTDVFGNTETWTGGGGSYTNKLGAVITLGGPSPNPPSSYTYVDTTGHNQQVTFTTGTTTFKNFIPAGNVNCPQMVYPTTAHPVTAINYPDGTKVAIGWEPNGTGNSSGIINSITLREGATISYVYGAPQTDSNCDYFYTSLQRTTPDGTTQYSLSYNVQSQTTTTTILDPGKNKTVYTLIGARYGNSLPPFLQSVYRYQNTGTVASPVYALISNTSYCYNNASCSTAPTLPITQRDVYEYVGANSNQMSHRVQTFDSTYGLLLTDATTDNAGSGQTKTTTYVYGTYNSGCTAITNTKIHDHICTTTTTVGSNTIAQSGSTYNANGALTKSYAWTGAPSTNLTTNYTPNSNGTIASVTAPNGQVTTNTYGNCNSLLLTDSTTTVNSVAIDNKTTWDCNGAVPLDTTDPNGNEADTTYDVMFRPASQTDRMENTTTFSYGGTTNNYFTSTDPLGIVRYRWTDGLGRTTLNQVRQSPSSSNYDTVSTVYQWNGTNFQTQTTVACVQTYGNGCPATYSRTELSNPVAGPISLTNANNGTTTYGLGFSSSGQDSSVTAGPAPSGEHTKVVQTEKDGFGRTKSVCSLETSGGTSCGQALGNSGILTSTSYSFASGNSTATTTRGSQTHTTVSDALGRATSVTTPEAGTVTSYYDTIPNPQCYQSGINESGFLTATKDNAGNYICPETDGIGRVYAVGSGSYCKRFVYDISTGSYPKSAPSGYPSSGANIIGRLVEAETDNCGAPLTTYADEWFAYDKNGRMTDMWQWSTNSGGYYHTTTAYNADGTPTSVTLAGQCSPTFTYGVDGEDRPNSMSICGNTTIVNSTGFQYDAASRPLTVPIGTNSGDQDTYTYDNVGNMTEYKFTINGTSDDGKLTWNPIGSLQKLVITDGFNSGGSQTCTFGTASVMGYDDVGRLLDDNCGSSLWHQSYSYDQYDNLTKTGNPGTSWNPGYNSTTNRMTGSTYDNGSSPGPGNLTYDGVNSYSWNYYGKMVGTISGNHTVSCGTSGSSCVTFDAFERIVESSIGNQYQQMLFSPIGLLGYGQGGAVYDWYVPAPGGGDFFMVGGVMYFLHPDWLQTKRLGTSLVNRSYLFDVAYAPYGDAYDSFTTSWYYTDFTGLTNEWNSGIYTTPNRQFTINSSRWPSPDPAHASWNAYSYVTNPNTQTDRSGLCDENYSSGCLDVNSDAGTNSYGPGTEGTCGGMLCTAGNGGQIFDAYLGTPAAPIAGGIIGWGSASFMLADPEFTGTANPFTWLDLPNPPVIPEWSGTLGNPASGAFFRTDVVGGVFTPEQIAQNAPVWDGMGRPFTAQLNLNVQVTGEGLTDAIPGLKPQLPSITPPDAPAISGTEISTSPYAGVTLGQVIDGALKVGAVVGMILSSPTTMGVADHRSQPTQTVNQMMMQSDVQKSPSLVHMGPCQLNIGPC